MENIQNFTLEDFRCLLSKQGVARNTQFYIELTELKTAGSTEVEKMLSMFAHSVSIPPRNVLTAPYRIEHAHYEMPYGISYEPISVTFYLDAGLKLREYFVEWMKAIHSPLSGIDFYDNYTAQLYIYSLDKQLLANQATYQTHLVNVYPKSISEIQYSSSDDGVASLTVHFVYERLFEERYSEAQWKKLEDYLFDPFPYNSEVVVNGYVKKPYKAALHSQMTDVATSEANKAQVNDTTRNSVYYTDDLSTSYIELKPYTLETPTIVEQAFQDTRIRLSNKKPDVLNRT